jgi:hypothetical protein
METANLNLLVAAYISARDLKAALKNEYEAKVQRVDESMDKIEAQLMTLLDASGAESVRTESGTAYRTTVTYANVADWDTVLDFVRRTEHWQLLMRGVSKKEVEALLAETGDVVPGVNVRREMVVNVRRS